jgi:predicted TIM-barrel fold metal-dependent hydrolase
MGEDGTFSADWTHARTAPISHGNGCLCGMSRRNFLAGALAAGAAAATSRKVQAQAKPQRIDVHHHMLPPDYIAKRLAVGVGDGNADIAQWTPARTLEQLDRNGVATAMLSLSQPGLKFEDVEGTRSMLRYCNEYGAGLVRDHPGRFGLFVTLPLSDIDGSLRELEYGFDVLKADGVGLLTSYGTRYPGNPHFDPIWQELNRRKAVVFMHPNMPACCAGILPDVPGPTIEYQFNTARAITNLLYTGTLNRYPDIRYIFCHAGGALIPQVGRVVRHAEESRKVAPRLPNGPWAEIKKLHFDIAQAANTWNLGATRTFMPISQILLGSDYPFVQVADTVQSLLELGLSEPELNAVARDNALRLFPRLKAA